VNADNAFDTISIAGKRGGTGQNNVPEFDELRFGATSADVLPLDFVAPGLVSTDNASGSSIERVATFDEEIYIGTGDIRIVNETTPGTTTITLPDPQVVVDGNTLTITPAAPLPGGDTYHIEIDAGALTDRSLNPFAGISDPDTWEFTVDDTPPSVTTFADNTHPLPILTNVSGRLVYTVTFSEPIDAGSVETSDFGASAGSVPVTVDAVNATGDPAVYEVEVSTGGTSGSLTLEIVASAVISDLNGNDLDTTTAIPSDNTLTVNDPVANAGSVTNDFQTTIASQLNPNTTGSGEGRYFHVSVNEDNPGTGWYCANDPTGTPKPAGVRNYTGPVIAYKMLGNSNNSVSGTAGEGGEPDRITYETDDLTFDGFGQQQMRLWTGNDPGADLATGDGTGASGFASVGNYGYRDWQGAKGLVDITGLASGSVHIYYGAYNSTPTLKIILHDLDNVGADIVIDDAHSVLGGGNGDAANNGEYYVAEIDFVTDGVYDVLEYEWYSSNGRGLGTVLTGPDVVSGDDYTTWATIYAPADLSDPNGDFDGDGLSNDYERQFGLDPTDGGSVNPFTTPFDPAGVTSFSFTRRDNALTGLFTSIETSFDLVMWTEDTGAVVTEAGAPDGNGIEVVDVTLSPGLLTSPRLFVRVNQNEGILLSENFEGGDGGFTVSTAQGTSWAWGAPNSSGFGGSVTEGYGMSTNCWGTNVGNPGYYLDPTTTRLRSPVIDLTSVADAEVTFAEALDLEAGDSAVLNIIDDTTDTVIAAAIYTAVDGDTNNADWALANGGTPIAIPPAALGQPVRLEWVLVGFGGASDDYLGWYIDDVTVKEVAP
ncbi:Ig-like domain-containing protein, partial [Haloferula helveola]